MSNTIDLTPTPAGYAAMGATFVAQLRQDFTKTRREDATAILKSVLDIAVGLGSAIETQQEKRELIDALCSRI